MCVTILIFAIVKNEDEIELFCCSQHYATNAVNST